MKPLTHMIILAAASLLLSACVLRQNPVPMNTGSVAPGTEVTKNGKPIALAGTALHIGDRIPTVPLVDSGTMNDLSLDSLHGKVLLLSIVPSIDTRVCEAQTHYLGEEGDMLPQAVQRITISRDTPFAQQRFAREAKLTDITYLSDYKEGAFGRSTGLLMAGPRLLARAIVLVDTGGIVRYIQVVPEITTIPDMKTAFEKASELAGKR